MLAEERFVKIYGGPERVAAMRAQVRDNLSAMAPLTRRQRDALRIPLGAKTPSQRPGSLEQLAD
jgi:hypothetical protein